MECNLKWPLLHSVASAHLPYGDQHEAASMNGASRGFQGSLLCRWWGQGPLDKLEGLTAYSNSRCSATSIYYGILNLAENLVRPLPRCTLRASYTIRPRRGRKYSFNYLYTLFVTMVILGWLR